jgi:hypothetical protein
LQIDFSANFIVAPYNMSEYGEPARPGWQGRQDHQTECADPWQIILDDSAHISMGRTCERNVKLSAKGWVWLIRENGFA